MSHRVICGLHRPTSAVFAADEFISCVLVGNAKSIAIPHQHLTTCVEESATTTWDHLFPSRWASSPVETDHPYLEPSLALRPSMQMPQKKGMPR